MFESPFQNRPIVSRVKKFAIIGTSSSGKTTLTHQVCGFLKEKHVRVDGLFQQDRRFTFDRAKLETDINAQFWMILNMMAKESELMLHDGIDCIVSDRSVLDFYAYLEVQYKRSHRGEVSYFKDMVLKWCHSYDTLYYLNPLPYDDDGVRPPRTLVNDVDDCLQELMTTTRDIPVTIKRREDVAKDILSQVGYVLGSKELQLIPNTLGKPVLIGGSYAFERATKWSDVDVYIRGDEAIPTGDPRLAADVMKIQDLLGIKVELRQVNFLGWDYLVSQGFSCYNVNMRTGPDES